MRDLFFAIISLLLLSACTDKDHFIVNESPLYLIYIKNTCPKTSFFERFFGIFRQILTFASHFRERLCTLNISVATSKGTVVCPHPFHFTPARQQLNNQSLRKHPDYPPGPMIECLLFNVDFWGIVIFIWNCFRS